jgi:hypothetical protein
MKYKISKTDDLRDRLKEQLWSLLRSQLGTRLWSRLGLGGRGARLIDQLWIRLWEKLLRPFMDRLRTRLERYEV